MLESIVTSKARIRLLLKFFLNPHVKAYLRELSNEFEGSTNAVRVELNRLVGARLLKTEQNGRNKYYSANIEHPLFPELNNILRKMTGLDYIHDLLNTVGKLEAAYVIGDYAHGIDGGIIDLVLIGDLNSDLVQKLITKTEVLIGRKIRPLMLKQKEFLKMAVKLHKDEMLLLWGNDPIIARDEGRSPSPLCGVLSLSKEGEGGGEGQSPSPLWGEGRGEGEREGEQDTSFPHRKGRDSVRRQAVPDTTQDKLKEKPVPDDLVRPDISKNVGGETNYYEMK